MDMEKLKNILQMVEQGQVSVTDALDNIAGKVLINSGDACIDGARKLRVGFDEVIYGLGKTAEQIVNIAQIYTNKGINFICTGLDSEKLTLLKENFSDAEFFPDAGMMRMFSSKPDKVEGKVGIITAGTSDAKVANEAKITLESMGAEAETFIDIGVAGIHRFFAVTDDLKKCDVLIVIAGMEGALPSVVAGMFPQPVIAVPTSVGYGTAMNGFTALFAMLTSCAGGVTVVNIDNGFGAATAAFRILNSRKR